MSKLFDGIPSYFVDYTGEFSRLMLEQEVRLNWIRAFFNISCGKTRNGGF